MVAAIVQAEIGQNIYCIHCRYNLRGLRRGGRCPECGELIETSAAPLDDPPFSAANPRWIVSMRDGTTLWITALVVGVLARIALAVHELPYPTPEYITATIAIVPRGLAAAAIWFMTRPDPLLARGRRFQWAIRFGVVTGTLGTALWSDFSAWRMTLGDMLYWANPVVSLLMGIYLLTLLSRTRQSKWRPLLIVATVGLVLAEVVDTITYRDWMVGRSWLLQRLMCRQVPFLGTPAAAWLMDLDSGGCLMTFGPISSLFGWATTGGLMIVICWLRGLLKAALPVALDNAAAGVGAVMAGSPRSSAASSPP